jgi:hypothetical protein
MHPAVVRVLAVTACWAWLAAPARSQKVKAQKWEDFYPDQRHKSHQSSIPTEVTDKFRATSSPYQRVPVDKRKPQDLPPCVAPRRGRCRAFAPAGRGVEGRGPRSDTLWPQIGYLVSPAQPRSPQVRRDGRDAAVHRGAAVRQVPQRAEPGSFPPPPAAQRRAYSATLPMYSHHAILTAGGVRG